MNEMKRILDPIFFGNSLWQWAIAGAIAIGVLIVLLFLRSLVRAQYDRLAKTPHKELIELPLQVVSRTTTLFIVIAALFAGLQAVVLPLKLAALSVTIFTIAAFWQAGLWATTFVLGSLQRRAERDMATDRAALGTLGIIGFIARVTIWAFVLLLTLENLGIQIRPLLAGLGIGGIAVALALQNVLGDLFASLAITLDRPFVVGDALAVDDFNGTVEYIGVKSTRLRSLSGEQIIIPNANLMSSRMRNHSRLRERRVVLTISVSQETSATKLAGIPKLLRSLIEEHQDTRFDRAHLAKIAQASFDFEAVYFVTTPDYNRHMDIQQAIILRLLETFERDDIAIAYPNQRLTLDSARMVESELVDPNTPAAARDASTKNEASK
jgi:small-conductance mechanosensitive channel